MGAMLMALALATPGHEMRYPHIHVGVTREMALAMCRSQASVPHKPTKPSQAKARKARLAKEGRPISEQARHEQLKLAVVRMLASPETSPAARSELEMADLDDYEALREAIRVVKTTPK